MQTFLTGFETLLKYLNEYWTVIIIIIGLIIALIQKIKSYVKLTNEEKIDIAKKQLSEIILQLTSDAEINYENWKQSGEIKRAQVIARIFEKYPILSKVTNQEKLILWIDNLIDTSLEKLRGVVNYNEGVSPNNFGIIEIGTEIQTESELKTEEI